MSQPEQQASPPAIDYSKVGGVLVGNQWIPIVTGSLIFDQTQGGSWQAKSREWGFTVVGPTSSVLAMRYSDR